MKKYIKLFTLFALFLIFQNCKKEQEIIGCTDKIALNYNPNATVMKDSSCIRIKYQKKKGIKIHIDNSKYNKVKYKFIYESKNDTTYYLNKYYSQAEQVRNLNNFSSFSSKIYHFKTMNILVSDTINISQNTFFSPHKDGIYDGNNIPPAKNIKVIEYIEGYEPKIYFIDINNNSSLKIINPRSYFRYKTNSIPYETILRGGFTDSDTKVQTYEGFFVNINDRIDYWFKDHSDKIYVDKDHRGTVYKTNIVRY
tara:strand:+ start:266 stop:1024 length:759 start_codon:yes stop_codon:yes gene_type:complete